MGIRLIPTEVYPDATQQSELDGLTYTFRFRWNERGACWHMDLSTLDGTPIAMGVRLVTRFPLLRRNLHPERPPGELYLLDGQARDGNATYDEFGTRYCLHYIEALALP